MEIKLVQVDGKTVGWDIVAETTEDKRILGSMRMVEFWGTGKTLIQYDGMRTDPNDDNYVAMLHYRTREQKEREHQAMLESLKPPVDTIKSKE